jgi:hypothetical protein
MSRSLSNLYSIAKSLGRIQVRWPCGTFEHRDTPGPVSREWTPAAVNLPLPIVAPLPFATSNCAFEMLLHATVGALAGAKLGLHEDKHRVATMLATSMVGFTTQPLVWRSNQGVQSMPGRWRLGRALPPKIPPVTAPSTARPAALAAAFSTG